MKTKLLFAFLLMLTTPILAVKAQSFRDTITQVYTFGVDSMEKEVVIEIPKGCKQLFVRIEGGLDEGKCKVILKNAEGVWQENLQLGYYDSKNIVSITGRDSKDIGFDEYLKEIEALDKSKYKIKGVINHTSTRPEGANWSIVFIPEKAEAEILVTYSIQL